MVAIKKLKENPTDPQLWALAQNELVLMFKLPEFGRFLRSLGSCTYQGSFDIVPGPVADRDLHSVLGSPSGYCDAVGVA